MSHHSSQIPLGNNDSEKANKREKKIELAIHLIILLILLFLLLWLTDLGEAITNWVQSLPLWEYISANMITTVIILLCMCIVIAHFIIRNKLPKVRTSSIQKLVLVDGFGKAMKEWHIQKETSVLIGKSSSRQDSVNIDLIDEEYVVMIAENHAVLNFSNGEWYIEDLSLRNGVGIKKGNTGRIQKIGKDRPYKIDVGDMIYLAKTRLLVK